MLTVALSSYYTGTFMIVFYVISSVAYVLLLDIFTKIVFYVELKKKAPAN